MIPVFGQHHLEPQTLYSEASHPARHFGNTAFSALKYGLQRIDLPCRREIYVSVGMNVSGLVSMRFIREYGYFHTGTQLTEKKGVSDGVGYFTRGAEEGEWFPSLDVSETKSDVVVKAGLPGVDAKDIDFSLADGVMF
jgi:hypothetical protein